MQRLLVTGVAALVCLLLLFLENRCSFFLGTQDLTAQITKFDEPAAPGKAPAQNLFHVQFADIAGNILTPTQQDIDALKTRLAGNKTIDKPPLALAGDIEWNSSKPVITLPMAPDVSEDQLRERLQSAGYVRGNPKRELLHLTEGIDLRGGVEFICRLHRDDGTVVPADDDVLHTLRGRLDERGLTEPQVTRLSNGDVDVVIPGGTPADAARTRKVLETTGRLEFRHIIDPYLAHDTPGESRDSQGDPLYSLVNLPGPGHVPAVIKNAHGLWDLNPDHGNLVHRQRGQIIAPKEPPPGETPTVFYLCGPAQLVGADVSNAYETLQNGRECVGIEFTAIGAARNDTFTHQSMDEQSGHSGTGFIAILFDGEVRSAPIVRSPSSASCVIEGIFTPEEIENLRTALRGGSLAVTPVVLSERVVGATLGEQTVSRSVSSMTLSFLLIVGFMWLYYRRLGTVANLCLVFTTFFIFCVLSIFDATMTLPGLAGLVLTIGMAVDTNILIFERIREELAQEKGLKSAISAGYDRAFLTIVDAHLTTFITAFILYWIGTGPVKGFGLTLMIGIIINLFSGVYIGRMLTDWLCRKRTTLTMARWVPVLSLPYVEWRWYGYIFSIVTSVVGVAWFLFGHLLMHDSFQRNFDIDFTGGNAAQVVFKQPETLTEVKNTLDAAWARDKDAFNLLSPRELRIQPYFASLGGDHSQSREWVFRARDQHGGELERERNALEIKRADIESRIIDLRSINGMKDPDAQKLEKEELLPLDARIKDLGEQISTRTEAFKGQLEKAFGDLVGHDGDEILAASYSGQSITLRMAVLEPVDADQVAGISKALSGNPAYAKVQVSALAEPRALEVEAELHGAPEARPDLDLAHDNVGQRLKSLIMPKDATLSPAQNGELIAVEGFYGDAANAAGARRVTIAKPFPSSEHFSGQVAGQMQWRALLAVVLSLMAILFYVAARFEFSFGMGAVISLLHDVTMTVGMISMMGIRIDLTVIAAILTIIGYSINDRIVTFDRIRENLKTMTSSLASIIDLSIAQTMPRTVLTTSTVILTVVVLLLFGGDALYAFNATLLIGLISGTYSSVFVACPLLLAFRHKPTAPAGEGEGGGSLPVTATPSANGAAGTPAATS